jgi:hypothetical protein
MTDGSVVEPAVLVHCFKGVSRSASIIIAYIMRERKILYKEAMPIVKSARRCIWPNAGFVEQLDTRAYLDYDIHHRDEHGSVVDTKAIYDKTRARWGVVEKRKAAERARGYISTAITTTATSIPWSQTYRGRRHGQTSSGVEAGSSTC